MSYGPEDILSIQCANFWNSIKPQEPFGLLHIPNGGFRNKLEAIKFKKMGVRAGVSDFLIQNAGMPVGWIELKAGKNKLMDSQKSFRDYVSIKWAEVRSLDEFIKTLKDWGILNEKR